MGDDVVARIAKTDSKDDQWLLNRPLSYMSKSTFGIAPATSYLSDASKPFSPLFRGLKQCHSLKTWNDKVDWPVAETAAPWIFSDLIRDTTRHSRPPIKLQSRNRATHKPVQFISQTRSV